MTTPQLISEAWETVDDPSLRDKVMTIMTERERAEGDAAWPSAAMATREEMAGLYPDAADPQFAARLFSKQEFYESRAVAAAVADGSLDPCSSAAAEAVFELTPVQRVVSRFLHPLTPYMGVLIDHGVGVGKTCTAVTIAEQFLEIAPSQKVIVIVPQALQENFRRTVFDVRKLQWDEEAKQWSAKQCTGVSYLQRLGLLTNPDLKAVAFKVEEDRRARYTITGYQAFANWIEKTLARALPASLSDPKARRAAEDEVLRRLFSEHLIIIDEAHNLRDTAADEAEPASAEEAAAGDVAENAGGKALNPYLRRIVLNAEGLRLVLMTATPMYNAAPEICLLLNYLIMNDTKTERGTLRPTDLFTKDGDLKPGAGQRLLERYARRYVTYMRGENPYTFPLRMRPLAATAGASAMWPEVSATKKPVSLTEQDKAVIDALPLVFTEPIAGSPPEVLLRQATSRAQQAVEGDAPVLEDAAPTSDAMLDARVQMGNISYPNMMYGTAGWENFFARQTVQGPGHKLRVFAPRGGDVDSVFTGEGLRRNAPKIHRIVESIKRAKGICFAYSQYIKAGALPIAVALERAGFQRRLADGSIAPLLVGVPRVSPVCAICGSKEAEHTAAGDHPFRPACYVLLTSDEEISPNFAGLVAQAAGWSEDPEWGPLGSRVKVIIGSRVASEGLDLKCVREMHIMDAWYHLNRTEQIIGRAIRYCSHSALRAIEKRQELPAMALNNCLIYLHALRIGDEAGLRSFDAAEAAPLAAKGLRGFETADMYAYRIAIAKAQMVGRVQRLLKRHAWDCNLELEAIIFAGLPPRPQVDAQGNRRRTVAADGEEVDGYPINDQDYTTYCDYQVCRHECAVATAREGLHLDASTFSVSDARRLVLAKQNVVRRLFEDQVMLPESIIQDVFADLPWEIASEALMELLDGRRFRLTRPDGVEGFLIKKAGYVVFQPAAVADKEIPMTLRYARGFQLRRRFMQPQLPVFARAEERPAAPRTAAAAAPVLEGAAPVAAPAPPDALLAKWKAWLTFVEDPTEETWPNGVSSLLRLWIFLLKRYAAVPEAKYVALRWWFDKAVEYPEQKALLEIATAFVPSAAAAGGGGGGGSIEALASMLRTDIFRTKSVIGFRVLNPTTMETEYYCRTPGSAAFGTCNSTVAGIMARELNNPPIAIPSGMGSLFGFLAPKKGRMVFKTLDLLKPKTKSAVGAECGNTSNKSEHHPRVRALQAAGRASDLVRLMLPDSEEGWREQDVPEERREAPANMLDLRHQPLCLYMEFLTRILDARRVQGKRWYLDGATAAAAGLKGRA